MASPDQLARLKAVVPAAQAAQRKWGVPASVTLAQWCTESSWGTSQLAVKCRNFFGVKASQLAAPETYEQFPTWEYESGRKVLVEALFAKYPTDEASFDAHGRLLATASRYQRAIASREFPHVFAIELQRAGYSTNPHYAADLWTLVLEHNLTQYDVAAPTPPAKEIA
jgi:flagellum-specific peptidoglycan hydrolase FlgJ